MGSPRALLAVAVLAACGAAFLFLRGRGEGPDARPGPRGPLAGEGVPPPLAAGPRVPRDATAEPPAAPTGSADEPAEPEVLDPADRPADWSDPPRGMNSVILGRTVRVRVHCVDAVTARPVAARWRMTDKFDASMPSASWSDRRWRGGDLAAASYVSLDGPLASQIQVEPPAGYVAVPGVGALSPVAEDVGEVRWTVALWPATDLVVTVLGPDGVPCVGARVVALTCGGDPVTARSGASDAAGVLRVPGLPFIPGAEIRATLSWDPHSALAATPAESTDSPSDVEEDEHGNDAPPPPPPVVVTLPAQPVRELTTTAHLPGPTRGADRLPSEGSSRSSRPIISETLFEGTAPIDPASVGGLRVRVRTAGGRPMRGAHVEDGERLAKTDAEGFAELRNVTAGEREVWVAAVGGFRWMTRVHVPAGARTDVELREPAGGRVDVEVVDLAGVPCPLASIDVWSADGSDAFDVEDGVQRVDDLTDVVGKRSFRRVAPGEVSVTAWWRGKAGEAKVVVEARGRVSARIVVR